MERDYQLLKDVLSVPTVTYKEEKMVSFLENWLTKNNFKFFKDFKKNNNIITCIKDSFIKINTEHSSLLNDSQKKFVKINTIYTIKNKIKDYYIISI